MAVKTLDTHIIQDFGVAGGKPRIAGHRITVANIIVWHERMGLSADEIAAEYDLSLADVYAALTYYFDHQQEIDDSIRATEQVVEEMKPQYPSRLTKYRRHD